jgi:glycosyltransferase involved in cell wall biosynthesis
MEKFLIRAADHVITVSESIGSEYSKLYGVSKPSTVLNCPNYQESKRRDLFRAVFNIRNDQKIFLYQGALSKGRGIDVLLDIFSDMDTDHSVLICMGYGPLEADIKKRASISDNVFFHPAVKPDVLLNYTGSADYGISFVEDVCLSYRYCLPNKMFEYIMSGIPVLVSNLPEMKRFVEMNGVGVVADENSKSGFKSAIEKIGGFNAELVNENVLIARRKFCWEEQERVLKRIYSGVKE